jgi:hypothetical protein
MNQQRVGRVVVSREGYDAAVEQWSAARERLEAIMIQQAEAEKAVHAAEEALAGQEAFPGIAAYAHAAVDASLCRIGYQCKIHGQGMDEGPF